MSGETTDSQAPAEAATQELPKETARSFNVRKELRFTFPAKSYVGAAVARNKGKMQELAKDLVKELNIREPHIVALAEGSLPVVALTEALMNSALRKNMTSTLKEGERFADDLFDFTSPWEEVECEVGEFLALYLVLRYFENKLETYRDVDVKIVERIFGTNRPLSNFVPDTRHEEICKLPQSHVNIWQLSAVNIFALARREFFLSSFLCPESYVFGVASDCPNILNSACLALDGLHSTLHQKLPTEIYYSERERFSAILEDLDVKKYAPQRGTRSKRLYHVRVLYAFCIHWVTTFDHFYSINGGEFL